jgi:hypothetical protein
VQELIEKLNSIPDAYFDFVSAIVSYAKKKPERLKNVLRFLNDNPEANSSDVIYFVSTQADFAEESRDYKPEKIGKNSNAQEK